MELKENQYKESEIGIIPYDWEVTSLGDITIKVGSGITPTGGEKVYKLEGRIFLRSQNIGNGKLFLQDVAYIDDEIHNTFTSSEIHEKDVFLNITGASIGRSAVANSVVVHGNVNQHVCIIRVNQASLDPYYLNYFLSSQNGQKQINNYQAGGNRQGLNFEQIKSFQIPLPTKPEQIAIATALSDTDALIENLEKLLVKKRNIKQCIMHKLLSPKKYWETRKIIDIVSTPVTDGPHETPRFLKEGIPFLSVNNLVNNRIDFNELRFISLEDNQLYSKKCKPQKNDILLGKAASVGKVAILDSDLEINIWSPIALIRPRNTFVPYFIYYYFQTSQVLKQIEFFTNSSSQGNIGMGDIERIEISYPPFDEQTQIAQVLTNIDSELNVLDQKLQKYKMIKQGMMQALLTGKIRLV